MAPGAEEDASVGGGGEAGDEVLVGDAEAIGVARIGVQAIDVAVGAGGDDETAFAVSADVMDGGLGGDPPFAGESAGVYPNEEALGAGLLAPWGFP